MIHYHGTPISSDKVARLVLEGGHALVSFASQQQMHLVTEMCQSFILDNGAFSAWRQGKPIVDWQPYYNWVFEMSKYPNFDWAIIPDVIDGDECANDRLLIECPLPKHKSSPVWHMHESIERLTRLCNEYPVVCLGSSGDYSSVGSVAWKDRMTEVFDTICDEHGFPPCKLHGLRMLNPRLFTKMPLSSADSVTVGRNVNIDKVWGTGRKTPRTKGVRALLMADQIEGFNGASQWKGWDYTLDSVFDIEDNCV